MIKGLFILSIFIPLVIVDHDPRVCRNYYHVVIWIFFNKYIKVNFLLFP